MKNILLSIFLTLLIAFPGLVFADEASIGGKGGNIKILNNSDVQMLDEIVKIDIYPSGKWVWEGIEPGEIEDEKLMSGYVKYDITYTFKNISEEAVDIKMGFPEFCDYECRDSSSRDKLQDFKTFKKQNNKWEEIAVEKQAGTEELQINEYDSEVPNWYVSELTFPPGNTEIKNTYWAIPNSYKAGMSWTNYTLSTGSSWKNSIESAKIVVTFHGGITVHDLDKAAPAGYEFDPSFNQVKWHFTDFEPGATDNIKIQYTDINGKNMMCSLYDEELGPKDASSWLQVQGELSYTPCYSHDHNTETAWVEGVEGDGIGEWARSPIQMEYNGYGDNLERTYEKARIFNGYGASQELWAENNRVSELKLIFSDGSEQILELKDEFGYQIVNLPQPIKAYDEVKLEIVSVYEGTKYDDTAISEFKLLGLFEPPEYEKEEVSEPATEPTEEVVEEVADDTPKDDLLREMPPEENQQTSFRMVMRDVVRVVKGILVLGVMLFGLIFFIKIVKKQK